MAAIDVQRANVATAIRNASTHQCIFTVGVGLDFAYHNGALYRVTSNSSQFDRAYSTPIMRVEDLIGMSDDEIWARVMGGVQ